MTITTGGQVVTQSSTSHETYVTTTPSLVPVQRDDNNDAGLSTSQRNTIIGVVVGVGGAILLGAIALVFLRLRKKRSEKDDDDMGIAGTSEIGYGGSEQSRVAELYSKPQGPVNQAANF
jgi:hypothetical protein